MGAGDGETVGAWRARKRDQGVRAMGMVDGVELHSWQDHGTRFDLVDKGRGTSLCIGRLARDGDPGVDLPDAAIDGWLALLREAS